VQRDVSFQDFGHLIHETNSTLTNFSPFTPFTVARPAIGSVASGS